MSQIVFAWELGADLGHLSGFLPLALRLRERGHAVTFVARDLANVQSLLGPHGFRALQAPLWLGKAGGLPKPPLTYAEIVLHCGYDSPASLTALVAAWRGLFELLRAELVICDHAPSALLAARSLGLRRALYGLGFFSPPRVAPLPVMRPWHQAPAERVAASEQRVLDAVNAALAAFRCGPLARLADLFDADEDFLCTYPELDHYPGRAGGRYWGPVYNIEQGVAVEWREPDATHVFAYVKPRSRDFERVTEALRELDAESLVFAPGLGMARARKLATDRMRISLAPLRLAGILQRCDLAVCHAGLGTLAALLLHGVPVLALPMQLEQYLTGRCVAALGAGLTVKPDQPAPDYRRLLRRLLAESAFRDGARGFAARHADHDQARQFEAMAGRIGEILGEARRT